MATLFDPSSGDKKSNILLKTRLMLELPPETPPEPLPIVDYHLLYLLIHLAQPYHSDPRFLKRYDYLADARMGYYTGISKFHAAFEALLGASAHGEMLDQRFETLRQKLEEINSSAILANRNEVLRNVTQDLAGIEIARRKNNEAMRGLLLDLEEKARIRDYATSHLSSLKWCFVRTQFPGLVEMGKQIYAWKMGKRNGEPRPVESVFGRQNGADGDGAGVDNGSQDQEAENVRGNNVMGPSPQPVQQSIFGGPMELVNDEGNEIGNGDDVKNGMID